MTCCQILYLAFVKEKYSCKQKQQQAGEPASIELLSPLLFDSSGLLINRNEDETAVHWLPLLRLLYRCNCAVV